MNKQWTIHKKYTFLFIMIILLAASAYWLSCNFILPTSPPSSPTDSNNATPQAVSSSEEDTKESSSIIVNMSISNPPLVGETASITLSVTPLIDAPNMEIGFRVPEGIEAIGERGKRKQIIEGRPPYVLEIRKPISLRAGENRNFVITIKVLREGKYKISGGAVIYGEGGGQYANAAGIRLDVRKDGTVINPPVVSSAENGKDGTVGLPATGKPPQPKDDLLPSSREDTEPEKTTKTPEVLPPDQNQ